MSSAWTRPSVSPPASPCSRPTATRRAFENYGPLLETLNASATRPRPAVAEWQQIVDDVLIPMIQQAVEDGADTAALLEDAREQVSALVS